MTSDGDRDLADALARAEDKDAGLQLGRPLPDRITVAGNIYHQSTEGDPTQVSLNFERILETHEQVFHRRLKVGEDWMPLIPERCWLQNDQVGMIVVRNDEGRYPSVQPSREEGDELQRKVLWVSDWRIESSDGNAPIGEPYNPYLIYPKDCIPLTVLTPSTLVIRSARGEIRYAVFVFPR